MSTVSTILIVKNEAESLADCLDSVAWSDEIIVLDSGSSDSTLQIAKAAGARVYVHTDWKGFGHQRQIAQGYARCDWVFWIDADERVTDELAQEIKNKVQLNRINTAYEIPRLSYVFGRYIRHSGWYPDYVVRLYPREKTRYDDALVHEKVLIPDEMSVERLHSDMIHYTYKDLNHYLTKSAHYAKLWADQKQKRNKKTSLLQACLHGVGCFVKMYLLKRGFLDGRQGLLLALLSSHSAFIKYADVWVRNQN